MEIFYIGLAAIATVVSIGLFFEDQKIGRPYNRSHWNDNQESEEKSDQDAESETNPINGTKHGQDTSTDSDLTMPANMEHPTMD